MVGHEERRPEIVEGLATAVYPSFAMLAGLQLDIFTPLAEGPMDVDQIGQAIGVRPEMLRPLLYALTAVGLLHVEEERFSNSSEASEFLIRGRSAYIGMRHYAYLRRWRSMLQVAETIRTGVPQGKLDYGNMSRDERESFYRGTYDEAYAVGRELVDKLNLSDCRTLVDLGGGSGGLAIALAQANPQLHVTVADLPTTTPIAERYIKEAGVEDRVEVLAENVVDNPLPGAYDVAILRGLLIVLPPNDAQRAVANIAAAVEPGGAIYVMGWILDDSRVSPEEMAIYNLHFINSVEHGSLYTEREISTWLADAGITEIVRERATRAYGSGFVMGRKQ
jgi:SAM-dependent methyltransferase